MARSLRIRVTNDEKNSWDLTPEETALRAAESEQAGKILGVKEVISMGYRAAELADVPFTNFARPAYGLHPSLQAHGDVYTESLYGVRPRARPLLHRTRRRGCMAAARSTIFASVRGVRS